MRKVLKGLLFAALAVCAVSLGGLTYLGYFGGPLFIPIAAEAAPNRPHAGIAAVVLSGDMGFNASMARQTAHRLAQAGIPVIAVNSLAYFKAQRSPAEVERLLAQAIRRAQALGKTDRVVMIGQSFGADMIPVGLSLLPPDLRAHLVMVGLVVPTDTLFLHVSLPELFEWTGPDADALPTARALDWLPVACISGRDETTSLCPHMTSPNVSWTQLPGGHHLNRDPDAVHRVLLPFIDRAAAAFDRRQVLK